jgi:two-component system, NtrC family, sensor kinase
MSLRWRTLLIGLLLMLVTAAAVHVVQYHIVYPQFIELEQEQARRNAELVLEVVNRELALVAPKSQDWGYWDATFRYMGGENPSFESVELIPDAQLSLDCEYLGFYDTRGRKVWSRGMDLASKAELDIDAFRGSGLPMNSPILSQGDVPQMRAGLIDTNLGLMFVTSTPVLTGARTGPSRGTVVMGKRFDIGAIRQIADQNHLRFELAPPQDQQARGPRLEVDHERVAHGDLRLERIGRETRVTAVVFDLDGKPVRDISVITPREISARGWSALMSSMVLMGITAIVTMVILLWLLNATIVVPLTRLTTLARRIGADDSQGTRLNLQRRDEIGLLGKEFDRMLDRLADTRRRLLNESYRTGASEMAGGVIRDLRSSLEPLREHIDQPLKLLDRAHTSGQQMLLSELASPGLSHHRHNEIVQMLLSQVNEQAELLAESRGELRSLRRSLEHLQGIVTEYSRFIGSANAMHPVPLHELIAHALRKLPDASRASLAVEIDDGVRHVPPAAAARELLQQVINVVVAQAAQARRPATGPLHLRVIGGIEMLEGRAMVHFRFEDNRPGVRPELIRALFERVWTVGDDLAGLTLPWADNVVASMGGRLFADALAPEGLVIHLWLPRAKPEAD